jgi:hypothetical protein
MRLNRLPSGAALLLAAATVLGGGWIAPAPARADIDFAASLSVPLDDDGRLFINVASNYYHAEPQGVILASRRLRRPAEEIPIVLFLAERAHRPIGVILDLRAGGRSWIDIFVSFGLPYSVLFADLPPNPGPPYGKAWGYWKKHRSDGRTRIVLTDHEFADLVHLHVGVRAVGLDAREAMRLRAQGKPFRAIAGNAWRAKQGKPKQGGSQHGKPQHASEGADKGKPKGHGKP